MAVLQNQRATPTGIARQPSQLSSRRSRPLSCSAAHIREAALHSCSRYLHELPLEQRRVVPGARGPPPMQPECIAAASWVQITWVKPASLDPLALFFDWRADQAAPLRPGTIIVAYRRIAQQVMQGKPGMAA